MNGLVVVLLLGLIDRGTGHADGELQCAPQNVRLSDLKQRLVVSWENRPSCSSLKEALSYELEVLRDGRTVHHGFAESRHTWWSWASSLPLECASHSVRIRSRIQSLTGPWTEWTLPGLETSEEIQIFPQDHIFAVGSRATFCCIIPQGEILSQMFISNYKQTPSNTSKINNQTYALTVDFLWPTLKSDVNVICESQTSDAGECAIIGYPPLDRDLKCETRDFQSVECLWAPGPQIFTKPTQYNLLKQSCRGQALGKCSQKAELDAGEKNWTLIARNDLGIAELSDEADLTKRVHMFAPEAVAQSAVSSTNVSLSWTWTIPEYNTLSLKCQLNLSNAASSFQFEKRGVGLRSVVVSGLVPNWSYTATVRCATETDFWKWGDWSRPFTFHTKGDVPDALDVWMQKEKEQTVIKWKMLELHQSHGHIIDYEVTWINLAQTGEAKKRHVVHPGHSIALPLGVFEVQVTARNEYGSSSPSRITVSSHPQEESRVSLSRISGAEGGFGLSWSASPDADCGYVVEWCPASGECSVDWLKVPPSNTSASIYSKNLKDGVRYILSIHSCTQEAPLLLERREGYVKEKRIMDGLFKNLRWQQHGSSVAVSWDLIPLTQQSAFINGYILYCTHDTGVISVSTADPEATTLTAENLNFTSYEFTVKSLTALGECGSTTINATLNLPTDNLIAAIVICLLTAFTLLLLITVICYRHWGCIKRKVYPPIPEPVLMGKWLTSQDEERAVPHYPSNELVVAVTELHPSSEDRYICQKDTGSTQLSTQSTLCKKNPSQFILPQASIALQPGLSSSTKCNLFQNPIYNLLMQKNDIQTSSEGMCDCTFEEEDSSGYQPQDMPEILDFSQTDSDSIMTCVSAYIVLPHAP